MSQYKSGKRGAYLLRYWQEYEGGSYRFMLKSINTNHDEMFPELSSLIERLQELLENGEK